MHSIPLIRSAAILPFVQFLDRIGAPTDRILQQAGLPMSAFEDAETLIPLNQSFVFGELAARSEGLENLGLLVGQHTHFSQLGTFGALVCQSLTLHDLLTKLLKLHRTLLNGEQIWLTETQDSVWLHHRYTVPQHIPTYQGQYYTVLMYLNAIRLAAGATWQPEELHLSGAHKLKGLFELESLANTRIYFYQPTNAIRLPKTMLSQPLIRLTNPVPPRTTEEVLNQTAPADDFPDSLSQLIRSLLPYSYPNLAVAADSAGVGLRTFQRRLQDRNLIYSTLVEQIRFERATELLQDRTLKLIDIAFEVGYTDAANFSKAFKRWTGLSPREFRNLHLKGVD